MMVSIIVPCYNAEKYLMECLNSIIGQHYALESTEIIIVDDYSTDNTRFLLEEFEKAHSDNVIYIPLDEHIGLPGTVRNIALDYATGDYIVFLDSDDILENDFLQKMVATAEQERCDVVSCGYTLFNNSGVLGVDSLDRRKYDTAIEYDKKRLICNEGTRTSVWARIYRREFLDKNHIRFSEEYHIGEDMFFWHQCVLGAMKSVSIDDDLYRYRIKEDSIFHAKARNYAMDVVNCIKELSEKYFSYDSSNLNCREEYAVVAFYKCGYELLDYMDAHDTPEDLFACVISEVRDVLRKYWSDLPKNKYLNNENSELAKKIIG